MAPGPITLAAGEGITGALMLLVPERLLGALCGGPVGPVPVRIARILGARQLVQAVWIGGRPTRGRLRVGALVDGTHAASMLALAAGAVGPRRLTLASASVATVCAGVAVRLAART